MNYSDEIYLSDRFRMVLRRANVDRLERCSSMPPWVTPPPFIPLGWFCKRCVCELMPSWLPSILIEPALEFVFSIAAISSRQLKNDCFWYFWWIVVNADDRISAQRMKVLIGLLLFFFIVCVWWCTVFQNSRCSRSSTGHCYMNVAEARIWFEAICKINEYSLFKISRKKID